MFFVYVIESIKSGKLYHGFSENLEQRLEEHNRGSNFSTAAGRPWRYIYTEGCLHKKDATRREMYLKTTQGRRLLQRRLKEYFYEKKNLEN